MITWCIMDIDMTYSGLWCEMFVFWENLSITPSGFVYRCYRFDPSCRWFITAQIESMCTLCMESKDRFHTLEMPLTYTTPMWIAVVLPTRSISFYLPDAKRFMSFLVERVFYLISHVFCYGFVHLPLGWHSTCIVLVGDHLASNYQTTHCSEK
jgi:hypothetical protein